MGCRTLEEMRLDIVMYGDFTEAEVAYMDTWKVIAEWLRLPLTVFN